MRSSLLALVIAVPAYGQSLDSIRHRLARLTTTDSVPSIAVAVARDGAIVWEEGFGWADKERHVRATPHTSYAIASVTKTMTATELLVLRDARRLDLDRPANAYLSSLPDSVRVTSPAWNVTDVTVHRLANHTAGLPTHYLFCFTGTPNCEVSVPQAIARYAVAIRLPGERFDYSNLGYGVLGVIVECVTGRSLNDGLRRDVFQPLEMNDTFIGLQSARAGVAASYANGGARVDGYHSTTPAASDGYASVHDLARFGLFHLHAHLADERQIIPDSVIDWMQSETVAAGDGYQYGFGWWVDPTHFSQREVFAQGGTSVASALLLIVPTEHLAVAVATNTGFPLNDIGRDIVAAYVPGFAVPQLRVDLTGSRTDRPVAGLVDSWTGDIVTYRGRVPYAVRIDSLGRVHATVGRSAEADVGHLAFFADGRVEGTFSGTLPVDEYRGRTHHLEMELAVHGRRLTGYVTALLEPGAVEGIGLTYWADLHRR